MRAWLVASAVLLLAFAPAPLPRQKKSKDLGSQILGTWRIRTIRYQGSETYTASSFAGFVVSKTDRVTISSNRITFQADGASSADRAAGVLLSGGPGEVRHIDFGEKNGVTYRGLYKLSGGSLYLAFNHTGGPRPNQMTGDGGEIAFILDRR